MSAIERGSALERYEDASVHDGGHAVEVDTPTLVAVSALAWVTANVFHEIIGHAGAAVVLGIPVRAVSTTTASIEWDAIESVAQDRIINAAATPVNVLTGVLALVVLRRWHVKGVAMRYFLWLFAVVSFTMASWNLVTLPLLGAGDWGEVAEGLDHAGLWTGAVIGVGVVVATLGYRLPLRLFLPDLRDQPALRHQVVFAPVATMIVVQTLSVLPSPFATAPGDTNHLLASVFAYAHLIVWAVLVDRGVGPRSIGSTGDIALHRSTGWLGTGLVVVVVFVAVLGPGVGPLADDPRLDSSWPPRR